MADVYATFADGGVRNSPIAITKVVFPDGHVDTNWGTPHRERVLTEPVAGELTAILHQNVLGGTATRSAINCPTAAKTGTTNNLIDAWLDGYNSEYATAVWMGYPTKRVEMTDVHGEPQQGGYLPAEIWHAFMAPVTEGHPCATLKESSAGIVYAPFYGKYAATGEALATEGSRRRNARARSQEEAKVRRDASPLTVTEEPHGRRPLRKEGRRRSTKPAAPGPAERTPGRAGHHGPPDAGSLRAWPRRTRLNSRAR